MNEPVEESNTKPIELFYCVTGSKLLIPTLGLKWSPLPPTSHRPLSSEPTQSEPNRTAGPSWQDDIKKGGGEEEGAELKESARSPSQSPPSDGMSEAAGDHSNQAPRHGIPKHPLKRSPRLGPHSKGKPGGSSHSAFSGPGSQRLRPPHKCQQAARPAPSPNTHSLTAPQQEQRSRLLARAAQSRSQCQARTPAASSRSREPWPASAPRALHSGEDNGEKAGAQTASQMARSDSGAPRPRPLVSHHQACRSPPQSTLREPRDPVRKQRRMGLTAPSRAPYAWPSAPVPWIACQLFPGPCLRDTHLPGLSGLI